MSQLEAVVEQSSLLFIGIDDEARIQFVNDAVEEAVGYGAEQLNGTDLLDRVHDADRENVASLLEGGRPDAGQYRFRSSEDAWIWLEAVDAVTNYPAAGQVCLVSRRIPDQSSVGRKLNRYRTILDSLSDAVYAIEPDGTIVYVNESYADMKGVDRTELLGTDIYRWGSSESADRIGRARRDMSPGDVGIVEMNFLTVEGDTIPVELRINTVTDPSLELERVGVFRDITERKEREDVLERKNQRLEEFSSIVSHDLRNPLNVAKGRLELAMLECDSEHLDDVDGALDRMNTLIEDLLTLAREGDAVRELEPVDLPQLATVSWQNVETLDASLDIRTDQTIDADRSRLQQLLENLFRNAVEHGGDAVTVTMGELDDGFYVEDDGPGIVPDQREDVFEAGFSTSQSGTGFGLSIVHQIATAHEWDIQVTDGTHGGARFEITWTGTDR